jgi:protein SCO1/2
LPRKLLFALLPVFILLSGCHQTPTPSENLPTKTFTIRGKVISTDATHVTLDHEAVPGFMEAMTMPYKVKDPSVLSELHPGDRITARLTTQQDAAGFRDPVLDNIVVISQARPDYKPTTDYHVPQAGDSVPNFALLNQDDRTIHLAQFKGKVVLITFIYTRCPFDDYCPRMNRNFAAIDKALAADPAAYSKTHLISISFDPTYDTPKVLRAYGETYIGNHTKQAFTNWDFAAPSQKDLPAVTQFFNVGITGEGATLNHSLSTIILGKDGKIAAWYPTNDWDPTTIATQVKQLAAA